MNSNTIFFAGLFFLSSSAMASQDCRQEVKAAIQKCNNRIQSARNSQTSDFNNFNGVPGGTANQSAAVRQVSGEIGKASALCESVDLAQCVDDCNAAMAQARSTRNINAVASIKDNMKRCSDQIDSLQKGASASQAGLNEFDKESRGIARSVSDSNYYNDQPIPQEQGQRDPNITNVNDTVTVVGVDINGNTVSIANGVPNNAKALDAAHGFMGADKKVVETLQFKGW